MMFIMDKKPSTEEEKKALHTKLEALGKRYDRIAEFWFKFLIIGLALCFIAMLYMIIFMLPRVPLF